MAIRGFFGQYRWLSNFYHVPINYEGILYPTVEHAYQAAKTLDTETREFISKIDTPGKAKQFGKALTLRSDWANVRLPIMGELLRIKFYHPSLAQRLLSTDNQELIEENYWGDVFWGVCNNKGENNLGELIMQIREDLWRHYHGQTDQANAGKTGTPPNR